MDLLYRLLAVAALLLSVVRMPSAKAAAQDLATPVALAIVIDNSGSMDTNDAENLRYAATRLIYEVADSNDQIGVICFGSERATMLPLAVVGDASTRRANTAQLTKGACPVAGGTVIGAALDEAVAALSNASASRRYILLLTDGEPNDPNETFAAVDRAQQQQVPIVPVSLYPGGLSDAGRLFQEELRRRRLDPRTVTNTQDLVAEFATIYSLLKPDRYVTRLGLGEPGEMRINALQQVNRVLFVLGPDQPINESGQEISCISAGNRCIPDVEGKFSLISVDQNPVEGIWRLRSAIENAVAITRASFRPRLSFPPVGDTAQPGYFLPGRTSPIIIADLEGAVADDAPVTINGDSGRRVPGAGQTYIFSSAPSLGLADVHLGTGDAPLVISKQFTLTPVPDPEGALPQLEPANPDSSGQITLANDSQFTLVARVAGDLSLTSQLTVRAVIFDSASGAVLYGPTSLFASGDLYQSNQLISIEPGIPYQAVIWLEAVRARDQLRYGDQISLDLRASGGVVVNGIPSQRIDQFDGREVPITVDVTEANTTVGLSAQLEWARQPDGANADSVFGVQLADSQFQGRATGTSISLTGPDDLCTLPEGEYEGAIVFTSSNGLPVSPPRVAISGRVSYGAVEILTTQPVDLGLYCSLPGLAKMLCQPVGGNEERPAGAVELRAPGCLTNTNIAVSLNNLQDSGTTIKSGPLTRTGDDAHLSFTIDQIAPQRFFEDFALRRLFTGELSVGRADDSARADSVNITYAKFSGLDVVFPWNPFLGRQARWGNLLGLIVIIAIATALLKFTFGRTQRQTELIAQGARSRQEGRRSRRERAAAAVGDGSAGRRGDGVGRERPAQRGRERRAQRRRREM